MTNPVFSAWGKPTPTLLQIKKMETDYSLHFLFPEKPIENIFPAFFAPFGAYLLFLCQIISSLC